jgi:arylsulfatase A-like enzyme
MKYNANGVKNVQLFDLASDPYELKNLAADPKFADQLARMDKLLSEQRKLWEDSADFDGSGIWPTPKK